MTQISPSPSRRGFFALCATGAIGAVAWRYSGGSSAAAAIAATPATFRLTDAEWRKRLSPQAYAVLRQASTEYPFTSPLNNEHRKGTFVCAGCALPLFASSTKFDSGTGWPSFYDHLPHAINERADTRVRTHKRDSHIGRNVIQALR